jgi:outer-membrane receptor for ferric coprogen and ferric-rhodotorulic acid
LQHNHLDREEKYSFGVFGQGVNDVNNGVIPLQTFLGEATAENTSFDVNIVGEFDLFGHTSGIIFGVDYQTSRWHAFENGYYFGTGDPITYIDVFNPVPRPAIPPITIDPNGIGYFDFLQERKQHGAYGQARLKLAEPLTIVVGGRIGWVKYEYNYTTVLPGNFEISGKVSPYAGFVFDISPAWSAYGSYASVFEPQDAIDAVGQPIGPLSGSQFELGIKGNVFSDAILLTVAAYRLRQTNRAIPDPNDFSSLIGSGEVEAKGIEAEINGEITPDWSINGGYVYTTNKFVEAGPGVTGQYIPIIPKHNIRLFTDYEFPSGSALAGLSLGAAIEFNSARRANDIVKQESYFVADVRAGYDFTENLSLSVNVNNIFDKRYYNSLFNATFGNVYGTPRSAMVTLRAKY